MKENPPPDSDKLPEAEAEERFRRLVGNLVNTPHQPHQPSQKRKGREKDGTRTRNVS
jgi:hypothetical protein